MDDYEAELLSIYDEIKDMINSRIEEFKNLWKKGSEERLFAEMAFCLLTPQSKARICWTAVENMMDSGVLFTGTVDEILPFLSGVRFKYTKARRIVMLRERVFENGVPTVRKLISNFSDGFEARKYLVKTINGYGYKEASHFLRNIGLGLELAILDRHILKNLVKIGVIKEMPKTLTSKKYLHIENLMRDYSRTVGIPMSHLDLLLWYHETGEVFK